MEMFFIQLFSCNLSSLAIKNNYHSRMKEMFFEDDIDDSKYCGHLYGLVTNFVQPYVKKGTQVLVQGSPEIEEYEKDGVKRKAFKIRLGGPGSTIRLCGSAKDKGDAHEAPASTGAPAADLGDDIPF